VSVTRLEDPTLRPLRRATDRPLTTSVPLPGTLAGDRQHVRAAALGDAAAWDRLVDGYAQPVWDTVRSVGLPRVAAEDVCRLVWRQLAQALPDLDGEPLHLWLRRAALREADRCLARRSRLASEAWDGSERRREDFG
jgi:hypothetical protein